MRDAAPGLYPAEVRLVDSQEELLEALPGADAVVVESLQVGEAELAAADEVRVVQKFGTILRNIDTAALEARGVALRTQRRRANIACAEHTLAMMLAMARNIPQADASLHRLEWTRSKFMGVQLQGKTLGVVGLGRVGMVHDGPHVPQPVGPGSGMGAAGERCGRVWRARRAACGDFR